MRSLKTIQHKKLESEYCNRDHTSHGNYVSDSGRDGKTELRTAQRKANQHKR